MIVYFQNLTIFLCPLYESFIIYLITSVIRMSDNIDIWILHRIQICTCIFLTCSRLHARQMKAGNSDIHSPKFRLIQIDFPLRIQDIQFCSQKQPNTVKFSRNSFQIMKVIIMAGSRHHRCMFCNSQNLKSPVRCCFCHFAQRIVCVAACNCMCMQIHHGFVSHFICPRLSYMISFFIIAHI